MTSVLRIAHDTDSSPRWGKPFAQTIYRDVEFPDDATLSMLHVAIIGAMRWTNSHLYRFEDPTSGREYHNEYSHTRSDRAEFNPPYHFLGWESTTKLNDVFARWDTTLVYAS